jgi:hypothetical protein
MEKTLTTVGAEHIEIGFPLDDVEQIVERLEARTCCTAS